jgi:hypothetical protein
VTSLVDKLITEWVYTRYSMIVHTVIFVVWFAAGWDIGLLTNIVSLEAIYLTLGLGVRQHNLKHDLKQHIDNTIGASDGEAE